MLDFTSLDTVVEVPLSKYVHIFDGLLSLIIYDASLEGATIFTAWS